MTSKEIVEQLFSFFNERDIKVSKEIIETITKEEFEVYNSTAIQIALKLKDIDHFHNYLYSYLFHLENLCSDNYLDAENRIINYEDILKRFSTFLSYVKLEFLDSDIQQFIKTHLTNN